MFSISFSDSIIIFQIIKFICDCNYVASNEADYLATQKSYGMS